MKAVNFFALVILALGEALPRNLLGHGRLGRSLGMGGMDGMKGKLKDDCCWHLFPTQRLTKQILAMEGKVDTEGDDDDGGGDPPGTPPVAPQRT